MWPTGSAGQDKISVKMLKLAVSQLKPLLLTLVNSIISTTTFPNDLWTTKIIPIEKKGKKTTTSAGWRPINILAAMSKLIERVLLRQMLNHLYDNDIIPHSHHGAIRDKSTQNSTKWSSRQPNRSTNQWWRSSTGHNWPIKSLQHNIPQDPTRKIKIIRISKPSNKIIYKFFDKQETICPSKWTRIPETTIRRTIGNPR